MNFSNPVSAKHYSGQSLWGVETRSIFIFRLNIFRVVHLTGVETRKVATDTSSVEILTKITYFWEQLLTSAQHI